ncbi:hypothetical protein [Hymenobacter weizhouensis]|uniref:hypothetical protein n=1 Tax=Hymenobacter sp. YIM 151500-1 TaxID=2987689 RepID=UPI002225E132|nr:hypothetical protein [Hymenobacter sp. YIM 151500-1]UYZ64997.1 hypothetical protein OIS53_09125 [Hymenobacter sp. YIM 151500-1]
MTYTVELKNEHALRLLEELEQLGVLTIQTHDSQSTEADSRALGTKKFTAVQLDTRGFKFNRDEANER